MKALIIHGGAGRWQGTGIEDLRQGLLDAVQKGYQALQEGSSALDACLEAVMSLEDNPLFNAGTGSVLTLDGRCEMDASIMRGSNLEMGAVAGVERIKNPILLAYKVMSETDHVLLIGDGAEKFARTLGFPVYDPITEHRREQWKKLREKLLHGDTRHYKKIQKLIQEHPELLKGTVGCVALDDKGEIVAGTSTGGTFLKLFGRVGDTPIPGAGTYATPSAGASATGIGEGIMRVLLSKLVTDLIGTGISPQKACEAGIDFLQQKVGLEAGVIALNQNGEFGLAYNSDHMPVAVMREDFSEPRLFGLPE